jgi:UDP-N-acetylglucosamine 2-epimerase (non-hydrolysing)
MSRLLLIFGTRPEAIKMAPVIRELKTRSGVEVITCVTAQHRQMLDQVLDWFDIDPDYDLNLMQPNQTLAGLTARVIEEVSGVIEAARADEVLVQGDTTTAMTAAMAAFYLHIPVGHIEAGLRTGNIHQPFPEEVNRHLISVMATHHFAPTDTARQALLAENTPADRIYVTGNTVIDALQWTVAQPYDLDLGLPLNCSDERLILVTAHRRESFGPDFESICYGLREIVERNRDIRLIYPVHLNPNVQKPVQRILGALDRIHLIDPLPYPAMAHLMALSTLVITDSGGIQEEAPALGKPVLVMRRTTERPEAVEAGTAKLVGVETDAIVSAAQRLLDDTAAYAAMATAVSPYGDGHAAERIADILVRAHL